MTTTDKQVLFRANKGDSHRWYLGLVDGRYCWWSHTVGPKSSYRFVSSKRELLNLVEWFQDRGFNVSEA